MRATTATRDGKPAVVHSKSGKQRVTSRLGSRAVLLKVKLISIIKRKNARRLCGISVAQVSVYFHSQNPSGRRRGAWFVLHLKILILFIIRAAS